MKRDIDTNAKITFCCTFAKTNLLGFVGYVDRSFHLQPVLMSLKYDVDLEECPCID